MLKGFPQPVPYDLKYESEGMSSRLAQLGVAMNMSARYVVDAANELHAIGGAD